MGSTRRTYNESGYAHTDPGVEVNQQVAEGEGIGTTDLSGRSNGGHAHFTFRPAAGQPHTDPTEQLPAQNNYTPPAAAPATLAAPTPAPTTTPATAPAPPPPPPPPRREEPR